MGMLLFWMIDYLNDSEPLNTESILEAWRNSVSRQHNAFIRRGESKLWMSSRKVSKLFFLKEACGLNDWNLILLQKVQREYTRCVIQSWLKETVEALGCRLLFLPKFHRELNFIEMLWSSISLRGQFASSISLRAWLRDPPSRASR